MIVVSVVLLLLGIVQHELRLVSPRLFLAAVFVALLVALRPHLGRMPLRFVVAGGVALAASVFVVGGLPVLVPGNRFDSLLNAAAFATLPWVVLLSALGKSPHPDSDRQALKAWEGQWQLPVLLSCSVVLLAVAHWMLRRDFVFLFDEPVYLLQAHLMREPGFARAIEEGLSAFFSLSFTVIDGGRQYTHYPPGQPAALAAFDLVGLRWWSGTITSAASVAFTYLLGRDLLSRRSGLIAAAMMATNQLFLVYGPSYESHGLSLALTTAGAWVTLRGMRSGGRSRLVLLATAGLLLGCLVAVRPLTGGTITLSIVGWQLLLARRSVREISRLLVCFAVGAALPFALLFAYNNTTNGSPLTFGYSAVHGSFHDLGFGERGWISPDENGQSVARTFTFGPKEAVRQLVAVSAELAALVYPAILFVIPLALVVVMRGGRPRWILAGAFLILPVVHFFYFYSNPRFYLDLFPFLFLAIAGLLAQLEASDRSLASAAVASILLGQMTFATIDLRRKSDSRTARYAEVVEAIEREQASLGRLLVFVSGERQLHFVSLLNIGEFRDNIIVARDLREQNARLMERFPDHGVIRVDSLGGLTRVARTP